MALREGRRRITVPGYLPHSYHSPCFLSPRLNVSTSRRSFCAAFVLLSPTCGIDNLSNRSGLSKKSSKVVAQNQAIPYYSKTYSLVVFSQGFLKVRVPIRVRVPALRTPSTSVYIGPTTHYGYDFLHGMACKNHYLQGKGRRGKGEGGREKPPCFNYVSYPLPLSPFFCTSVPLRVPHAARTYRIWVGPTPGVG